MSIAHRSRVGPIMRTFLLVSAIATTILFTAPREVHAQAALLGYAKKLCSTSSCITMIEEMGEKGLEKIATLRKTSQKVKAFCDSDSGSKMCEAVQKYVTTLGAAKTDEKIEVSLRNDKLKLVAGSAAATKVFNAQMPNINGSSPSLKKVLAMDTSKILTKADKDRAAAEWDAAVKQMNTSVAVIKQTIHNTNQLNPGIDFKTLEEPNCPRSRIITGSPPEFDWEALITGQFEKMINMGGSPKYSGPYSSLCDDRSEALHAWIVNERDINLKAKAAHADTWKSLQYVQLGIKNAVVSDPGAKKAPVQSSGASVDAPTSGAANKLSSSDIARVSAAYETFKKTTGCTVTFSEASCFSSFKANHKGDAAIQATLTAPASANTKTANGSPAPKATSAKPSSSVVAKKTTSPAQPAADVPLGTESPSPEERYQAELDSCTQRYPDELQNRTACESSAKTNLAARTKLAVRGGIGSVASAVNLDGCQTLSGTERSECETAVGEKMKAAVSAQAGATPTDVNAQEAPDDSNSPATSQPPAKTPEQIAADERKAVQDEKRRQAVAKQDATINNQLQAVRQLYRMMTALAVMRVGSYALADKARVDMEGVISSMRQKGSGAPTIAGISGGSAGAGTSGAAGDVPLNKADAAVDSGLVTTAPYRGTTTVTPTTVTSTSGTLASTAAGVPHINEAYAKSPLFSAAVRAFGQTPMRAIAQGVKGGHKGFANLMTGMAKDYARQTNMPASLAAAFASPGDIGATTSAMFSRAGAAMSIPTVGTLASESSASGGGHGASHSGDGAPPPNLFASSDSPEAAAPADQTFGANRELASDDSDVFHAGSAYSLFQIVSNRYEKSFSLPR